MRALEAVTEGKPSVLFFPSSSDFPSLFSGKSCLTEIFLNLVLQNNCQHKWLVMASSGDFPGFPFSFCRSFLAHFYSK